MSDKGSTRERLDKQAAAIKALRKDRDDLRVRVASLEDRLSFLETMLNLGDVPAMADGERQPDQQSAGATRSTVSPETVWSASEIKPVLPLVAQGTWVARDACLCCGGAKRDGAAMACRTCSRIRNERISTRGSHRPMIPTCLNCGAAKGGGGLHYLCVRCRAASRG